MRLVLLLSALFVLTRCGAVSDYSPDTGSNTSLLGNQGGAGVQAPLWSNDPGKKTVVNQAVTPPPQ